MILPFLKSKPSLIPPAIPISASRASPGPLTAQPITATVISLFIVCKGHATNLGNFNKSQSFNISLATFISSTGSSARETLIVSPIPSLNKNLE